MKLSKLETHDRYEHLIKDQAINLNKGAQDCLKSNPLSLAYQEKSPYIYLFAHPRTADDGVTKIMYWQPRLSKPKAQTNSYLFRAASKSDLIEVCWLIPPREQWEQYKKGNVTESDVTSWSINQFEFHRDQLERPSEDDMSEEQCKRILSMIIKEHIQNLRYTKLMDTLYLPKLVT